MQYAGNADLDIESNSAAAAPASKEKRMRALSEPSPMVPRFPVLLFLGICRAAGDSLCRARAASGLFRMSSPVLGCAARDSQHEPAAVRHAYCSALPLLSALAFSLPAETRCREKREKQGAGGGRNASDDSPLSGFPPHTPSIIGARESCPGLAEAKENVPVCSGGRGEGVHWCSPWPAEGDRVDDGEIGWWGSFRLAGVSVLQGQATAQRWRQG